MVHTLDAIETSPAPAVVAGGPVGRAFAMVNHAIVLMSSIALVIASFVLTYSVASRYFLHFSTDWQDELSVFLIVGAVFMSSASIQARRGHVAIEAIVGLLPPGVNYVRQIMVDGAPGCCSPRHGPRTFIRVPPGRRRCGSRIRS